MGNLGGRGERKKKKKVLFSQPLLLCGILNPSACCLFIFRQPIHQRKALPMWPAIKTMLPQFCGFCHLEGHSYLEQGLEFLHWQIKMDGYWSFADITVIIMRIIYKIGWNITWNIISGNDSIVLIQILLK